MSGTNEILPFAGDVSANVLTQAAYSSDAQRLIGNQPGIARSNLVNKAIRQATIIAAGLGLFVANRQANNITDGLTPAQVESYLQEALASKSSLPAIISGSATSWWRKSSDGYIEQGIAGITLPSGGSPVTVTFPIPFLTTVLDVQCSVMNGATQQIGWGSVTLTNLQVMTGIGDANGRSANIVVRGY